MAWERSHSAQCITRARIADMATLTPRKRAKLPTSTYALPKQRAYPIPDKAHARNAKARAAQALKKGEISKSEFDTVIRKANKKLGAPTASAARKKGLATAAEISKKAGGPRKKAESVAARKGTRKVRDGRTVTVRKGTAARKGGATRSRKR